MEVGVRLLFSSLMFVLLLPSLVNGQAAFALCSASFETACAVAHSFNLVVQMQMQFQNANQSEFTRLAQEMNRGEGDFVKTQMANDLYGFIWFRNGTCVGHPIVCRNTTQSMRDYIESNMIITTPNLDMLIASTAYYTGGPSDNQTEGIGSWLFYYWANELKRAYFLPVKPAWSNDEYYVGAGFNDVAALGSTLVSPSVCTPKSFALCASDMAQQLAQDFRTRMLRMTSWAMLTEFFHNVTNNVTGTRINSLFHGDIYGVTAADGSLPTATVLAHSNASYVGKNVVGTLATLNDTTIWSRFAKAALGHKFGAWYNYPARADEGMLVERFAFCLDVALPPSLITPFTSLFVVSFFDRIYDARASESTLSREDPGIVWIDRSMVWLLEVRNEGSEPYIPADIDKFIRTGINVAFTGGVVQPITRDPDGRFRITVLPYIAGRHHLNVSIQDIFQNSNATLMHPPVNTTSTDVYVYDPTNRVVLSREVGIAFLAWTLLTATMLLSFMIWTIVKRKTRVVFASSPDFMLLTATGLLLTLMSVILDLSSPNQVTCQWQLSLWFQHVGSMMAEASLVAKAYRLHRIFNSAKLQKVVLSRVHLYGFVGAAVLIQMILLLIANFMFPAVLGPEQEKECIIDADPGFVAIKGVLLVFESLPVVGAAALSYKLQDIPMRYNESRWLGLACMNWVIVVIFFIVTFFARVDVFVSQFFMCFCVVWVSFFTAGVLFIPKIVQLHWSRSVSPLRKDLPPISANSKLDSKLLPDSLMETIKAKETALLTSRMARKRAVAKMHSADDAMKACEAELFNAVAELAFQSQGQQDAWKLIESYRQTHARASINEDG